MITFDDGKWIGFLYDANGQKLRKTTSAGLVQDYVSGIEYENGNLEAIYHEEGRAIPDGNSFEYQYALKDHLGNVRVMFQDDGTGTAEIIQENHFYSFGLEQRGNWNRPNVSDYTYNGKEFNEDFGLNWSDYGARWYDPAIARWNAVDPLASDYAAWSPYNYTFDNPIIYTDPDGRGPIKRFIKKTVKNTIKRGGKIDLKADFIDTFNDYADAAREFGDGNWGVDDLVMAFELITDIEASDIKAVKKFANHWLGTGGKANDLKDRAKELHSLVDVNKTKGYKHSREYGSTTTAVTEAIDENTGEITKIVSSSRKYVPGRIQRGINQSQGERKTNVKVGKKDLKDGDLRYHAEPTGIIDALRSNLIPIRQGVSWTPCSTCRQYGKSVVQQ